MSTTNYIINNATVTDLGVTPCFIEVITPVDVDFVVADAAPANVNAAHHTISSRGDGVRDISDAFGTNVYAWCRGQSSAIVAVTRA